MPAVPRLGRGSKQPARDPWLLPVFALTLSTPAHAFAQRGGGKLMLFLMAAPMVLPLLGTLTAALGLRKTSAAALWWFLCAVLGLNSALLGALIGLGTGEATGVTFLLAQMGFAGTMLFTLPERESDSKLATVLGRLRSVSAFGVLPGMLVNLFFH